MVAMLTTSSSPSYSNNQDYAGFMDSRGTHHFTLEFGQLQDPSTYLGDARVMVGNGKNIGISHVGHVHFSMFVKPVHLKNVLHTPKISKQLISVTKLCFDNQAYVEFFPSHFLVKDQLSKKVLLQGNLENGLYKLNPVTPSSTTSFESLAISSSSLCNPVQALLAHFNNVVLWHNRLGHLASRVVPQVIKSCNLIPINSNFFCSACQMAKSHKQPFVISNSRAMKPFELIHSDL